VENSIRKGFFKKRQALTSFFPLRPREFRSDALPNQGLENKTLPQKEMERGRLAT